MTVPTNPKTVEDYLNDLSYDDLNSYLPSLFALEFVNTIKLIEGGNPENKTPVVHYKFIDTMLQKGNTINMCHRGFAKSTVKEYLIWYIAIFGKLPLLGKIPFAIYVSDSMDNGISKMRKSLEYRYNNSEFLQKYIPKIKFTEARWEFINDSGTSFVVGGYGAKSGVRGTRENNSRPVLALLDDLVSDTDARSPTVIKTIEETIFKAVFAALHPTKRKIIWSGTPFNANDPLYKAVESGAWNVNVFPVCEVFPCTEKEFKGSWEDRFTYESVKEAYDLLSGSGKLEAFNQEYMLRIMSSDDRLVEDSDINWFSRSNILSRKESYNCYITTDIAISDKSTADYMAISVWYLDSNGNWFLVDGILKRQRIDQTLDDLFRLIQIHKPMSVGIETSGQQGMLIPFLRKEMESRNIYFNFATEPDKKVAGIRPTTNKFARFSNIIPWFKSSKIYFAEELKTGILVEGLNELSLVSRHGFKSKHDDFLDTISMLGCMHVFRPSEEIEYTYDSNTDIWAVDDPTIQDYSYSSYLA